MKKETTKPTRATPKMTITTIRLPDDDASSRLSSYSVSKSKIAPLEQKAAEPRINLESAPNSVRESRSSTESEAQHNEINNRTFTPRTASTNIQLSDDSPQNSSSQLKNVDYFNTNVPPKQNAKVQTPITITKDASKQNENVQLTTSTIPTNTANAEVAVQQPKKYATTETSIDMDLLQQPSKKINQETQYTKPKEEPKPVKKEEEERKNYSSEDEETGTLKKVYVDVIYNIVPPNILPPVSLCFCST